MVKPSDYVEPEPAYGRSLVLADQDPKYHDHDHGRGLVKRRSQEDLKKVRLSNSENNPRGSDQTPPQQPDSTQLVLTYLPILAWCVEKLDAHHPELLGCRDLRDHVPSCAVHSDAPIHGNMLSETKFYSDGCCYNSSFDKWLHMVFRDHVRRVMTVDIPAPRRGSRQKKSQTREEGVFSRKPKKNQSTYQLYSCWSVIVQLADHA